MEPLLTPEREADFFDALTEIHVANDTEIVRQQALLSLGELPSLTEAYFQMMRELLLLHNHPLASTAALSSLNGRELEFLQHIHDQDEKPQVQKFLSDLAKLVVIESKPKRVAQLLKIGEEGGAWANMIADALIAEQSEGNPVTLAEEPKLVTQLSSSYNVAEKEKAMQLRGRLT